MFESLTWPFNLVLGINQNFFLLFVCARESYRDAGPSTSTAGVWWSTPVPFEPPKLWQMLRSARERTRTHLRGVEIMC